ncbi:PIG-L family deacetylase [Clostridium sp.]|uniref:PIG-L deacetylase family protein n=1 Tax=Clostridium sp. TaxID=1506 RepID=UPI003217F3FE
MNRELYIKLYNLYAKGLRVKNNLPIYSMKNSSYFKKCYSLEHGNEKINALKNLEGNKILILAPHVDDDIIGCGGAILKYIKNNKQVYVVYLTNGNKNGNPEERKNEAIYVASTVGIHRENLYFLNSNDKELITSNIEDELISVIEQVKPDTIFLPCTLDTHIDHFGASSKLVNAYNGSKNTFATIKRVYQYESQSPITHIYANTLLDITNEINRKMKTLSFYPSQKVSFRFFKELYRINGMFIGKNRYGECYIKSTLEEFNNFYINNFKKNEDYEDISVKLIPLRNKSSMITAYNSSIDNKSMLNQL